MAHPETQRKAQAEIDRVIGNDRLPTLADMPNLPYTRALVKEVFRWNPVIPLGKCPVLRNHGLQFPIVLRVANCEGPTRTPTHRYRERRIRGLFHSQGIHGNREHLVSGGRGRGTSLSKFSFNPIFPPPWFNLTNREILHDPATYANPMAFNPERFLGDHPEPNPRVATFGFGRRICEC